MILIQCYYLVSIFRPPPYLPLFLVCCLGVLKLGGLVLGSPWLVPLRMRLVSLFYSLKVHL